MTTDQCKLLRVRPALQLKLATGRGLFRIKRFMIDQLYWQARSSPCCAPAVVMRDQSFFEIGRTTNVERTVAAAEDVDEKGICWRRCHEEVALRCASLTQGIRL